MLVSPEYKLLLEHEHATSAWGTVGWRLAPRVQALAAELGAESILDYGAGRGSLGHWFARHAPAVKIFEYEPGRPELSGEPRAAALVTCIDVMEHVEPHCVETVLDHIQGLAQRAVYFNISLRPASRTLADGRNAHLTLRSQQWWEEQLNKRWQAHCVESDHTCNSFTWTGLLRT